MSYKLNISWYFALYITILFIIVNMAEFDRVNFFFYFKNVSVSPFGINKEKFNLFISLLTSGGLVIAIAEWMRYFSIRRKTDFNGLLEEIHHNFNIAGNLFVEFKEDIYWRKIYDMLKNQTELVYLNPDNSNFDKQHFYDCLQFSDQQIIEKGLIELTNSFIIRAITSDNIFSLKNQRIYINLGHLNYSILRHNLNVNNFNRLKKKNTDAFNKIQKEFYTWVHFRLSFMLVDLIMNTREKYFIDRQYVRRIKAYITKKSK